MNRHYRLGSGVVCSTERKISDIENNYNGFEINGEVNSGHSGGPIFNPENGKLVGMVLATAGSLKILDPEFMKTIDQLKYAVEPLILKIKNPNFNIQLSGSPPGWIKLSTEDPSIIQEMIKKIQKMISHRIPNIDLKKLIQSDGSLLYCAEISELVSIVSMLDLSEKMIRASQISYQMGIGISIVPNEISKFLGL